MSRVGISLFSTIWSHSVRCLEDVDVKYNGVLEELVTGTHELPTQKFLSATELINVLKWIHSIYMLTNCSSGRRECDFVYHECTRACMDLLARRMSRYTPRLKICTRSFIECVFLGGKVKMAAVGSWFLLHRCSHIFLIWWCSNNWYKVLRGTLPSSCFTPRPLFNFWGHIAMDASCSNVVRTAYARAERQFCFLLPHINVNPSTISVWAWVSEALSFNRICLPLAATTLNWMDWIGLVTLDTRVPYWYGSTDVLDLSDRPFMPLDIRLFACHASSSDKPLPVRAVRTVDDWLI